LRLRKAFPLLAMVMFLFISSTSMADDIHWLRIGGYLPSAGVESILFETADVEDDFVADTAGSLVVTVGGGGEIVKQLHVPDDFLLGKVHICFAASNLPAGPVTVKLYQGSADPLTASETKVVSQKSISLPLAECNEVMVFDPAADPPSTLIAASDRPLFLGIAFVGSDSPVYLKAVGIEEFSDTVEIDGCDTGVTDRLVNTDQGPMMLSALIVQCEESLSSAVFNSRHQSAFQGPPQNHGQYVKCVSHTLNSLKKSRYITSNEKGKIQRCAAKADIP